MLKEIFLYVSTYAIPLNMILYIYVANIRKLVISHMLPISIIGIIDIIIKKRFTIIQKILVIIYHLLFFILLVVYKPNQYKIPELLYLVSLFIPIIVIYQLPFWKYEFSKKEMIITYCIIYITFLTIQSKFFKFLM